MCRSWQVLCRDKPCAGEADHDFRGSYDHTFSLRSWTGSAIIPAAVDGVDGADPST